MSQIPLFIVFLFFLLGGVSHFIFMESFIKIMPNYLGFHKELVIVSGVFEILGAIGLLIHRTRLFAGYGLIALSIAVFPANINMALHPELFPDMSVTMLYVRLPLQVLIIAFIWSAMKYKSNN